MDKGVRLPSYFFTLIVATAAYRNNYSWFKVTAFSSLERQHLHAGELRNKQTIFLNRVTNEAALTMNVLVSPGFVKKFEEDLTYHNIQYHDSSNLSVAPYIDRDNKTKETFRTWEDVLQLVHQTMKTYPDLKWTSLGQTYEKRELFMLKILTGNAKQKPNVFIMGGEEGRDWISSAVILRFIEKLFERRSKHQNLIKKFNFYFVPISNPDGYHYSMTTDRFWSKNRRKIYPLRKCPDNNQYAVGVNLDRNWFISDNFFKDREKSSDCDSIQFGDTPFSEAETLIISTMINTLALNMIAFINVRGFERLITVPYGYQKIPSNNYAVVLEMLKSVNRVLRNANYSKYYLGTTEQYFYNYSGDSSDWVKATLNVPIVCTVYIKEENNNTVLPSFQDVEPLTDQSLIIISELLNVGQSVYGPLFNGQIKLFANYITLILVVLLLLLFR